MVATDTEREQILRCCNGDHEAFEQLITTHQRMIHALAFRMTGSLADADDLVQETFIQAHHQLGKFRGECAFSSWLYRIAMNQSLNWRKRNQSRSRLQEQWSYEQSNHAAPDGKLSAQVQEALMKLHPKQRAAVVLTAYDGLNHAEAARVLGCSETTVSWRIFAARRKLKRLLKDLKPEALHE